MGPGSGLLLGFLLGLRHAADADHVAAVSTLVAKPGAGRAWRLGASWGLGHAATLWAVGAAIIWFRISIPPAWDRAAEFLVGLVLIALGLSNMAGWGAPPGAPRSHFQKGRSALAWRSAAVGAVHGLSGSAAIALFILAAIPSPRPALAYLIAFGLGSVAGMVALSALMESALRGLAGRLDSADRALRFATGLLSFALGLWLAGLEGLRMWRPA